ncbi:MAG: hypothetical protein COB38_06505 [Gammaproteobacteria bacterium]|nr:MAG: hypothetical protein COB38_06505 [Gammaproteobacteria bacterium]
MYKNNYKCKKYKNTKLALIFFTSIIVNYTVQLKAIEFNYTLFSTLRHSNNLAQSANAQSGESLNSGGTFVFANEARSVWFVDMSGSISKEYFSDDDLTRQDRNTLAASINYIAPKSNFEFLLRDDFSQAPRDRFATQEVGNLVNVNVVTARPSYFFNITPIDQIYSELTYLSSSREGTQDDNSEIGAESFDFINIAKEIRYEKTLNTTSDISLVFNSIDTRFENESNGVDFLQDNLFLRWVGRGPQNQLQVEVGQTRVKDDNGDDFDTTLFNLLFNRQINLQQNIAFSIRNGVNFTISQNFIDDSISVDDSQGAFGAAQKIKATNLIYTLTGDTISGDFQLFISEYKTANGENNETRNGFSFNMTYSMSQYFSTAPQTNVTIGFQQNENTIENNNATGTLNIDNSVKIFDIQFNYFARPTLSYFIAFQKRDTSSTSVNTSFSSGDSESISIGVNYAPINR